MSVSGHYYREGSAARSAARFYTSGDRYTVELAEGGALSGPLDAIRVSDRIGNIERKLALEGGGIFATDNNDAIDRLFAQQNRFAQWVRTLESRYHWVAVALLGTVLFVVCFFKYAVPWLSVRIAHALPQQTNEILSASTFRFLDDYIFEETALDSDTREGIRSGFQASVLALGEDEAQYRLHFRRWTQGDLDVANALALPSGDIILTDAFVDLSRSQDEIDSVLLHEIGHVVHRHSLQSVIEASFVSAAVMLVTNDGGFLVDAGAGLGSLLVSSHYSRGHESEADIYALSKMLGLGIDPVVFSNILARLSDESGAEDTHSLQRSDAEQSEASDDSRLKALADYLSSHPNTDERKMRTEVYRRCFEQGQLVCELVE